MTPGFRHCRGLLASQIVKSVTCTGHLRLHHGWQLDMLYQKRVAAWHFVSNSHKRRWASSFYLPLAMPCLQALAKRQRFESRAAKLRVCPSLACVSGNKSAIILDAKTDPQVPLGGAATKANVPGVHRPITTMC